MKFFFFITGMREVSVFNQQETFFPSLTKDEMRECFVGRGNLFFYKKLIILLVGK